MPWYIVIQLLKILLLLLLYSVNSIVLNPVHWSSSNPMFKVSSNDHIIEVNMEDQIDFTCPHDPSGTNPDSSEYYVIYKVAKEDYDNCVLDSTRLKNLLIVNCSKPNSTRQRKFTMYIQSFSAIPNTPEFQKGETHYFITTSTGKKHGINNRSQGACHYKNMKLSIKVCCDSTTSPSPTPSTTKSTTISTTTTSVKWRSSTAKPAVTTKKQSDNKSDENDTLPKTDPQTSSGGSVHRLYREIALLQLLAIIASHTLTVFLLTNS